MNSLRGNTEMTSGVVLLGAHDVFLGVVVGGMVIAMYLPIFDMMNAVGG
ncbi:MAG: hypothetical protein ACT4O1_16280 [Gemmatimonadota bacterium]